MTEPPDEIRAEIEALRASFVAALAGKLSGLEAAAYFSYFCRFSFNPRPGPSGTWTLPATTGMDSTVMSSFQRLASGIPGSVAIL